MKLENLNKENVFKVPDGYFDTLEERIKNRVESTPKGKVVKMRPIVRIAIPTAIAAAIGLFILIGNPFRPQSASVEQMLAEVNTNDIIEYLALTDITTDEIIEVLDVQEVADVLDEPVMFKSSDLEGEDLDDLLYEYGDIEEIM